MATSVIDYIFRELAISYLGRNELAHAQPEDLLPDSMGSGNRQADLPGKAAPTLERLASTGYIRKSNLIVLRGSGGGDPAVLQAASGNAVITASVREGSAAATVASGLVSAGAAGAVAVGAVLVQTADGRLDRIREARLQGYEGDACGECGNFTLVRNGTCMKCATCGSTSGCS